MKKIFLLLTLTAVLVCLFAISASAATPNTNGESVTLDDGTVCPIWDTDGDALIWYKSTANTADGYDNYDYVKAQDSSVVDFYADGNYKVSNGSTYFDEVTSAKINGDNMKNTVVVVNLMDPDVKITSGKRKGLEISGFKDIFSWANNLEYAYLPTSLVAAMKNAMCGCPKLKYVNFEDLVNLEEIGQDSFAYNPKLFANTTLDLSKTKISNIGQCALGGSSSNASQRMQYQTLILPTTLKSLGNYPFQYSIALTTVVGLEKTQLKTITSNCFLNCTSLKNVYLPSALTKLDACAFKDCTSLEFVDFGNNQNTFEMPNWGVFMNCRSLKAISLPAKTQSIPDRGFSGCTALTAVYLGEDLKYIKGNKGDNADNGPAFVNNPAMYFVQEPFSVLKSDGTFYDASEFTPPEKPSVYYFPSTLKAIVNTGNTNPYLWLNEFKYTYTQDGTNYILNVDENGYPIISTSNGAYVYDTGRAVLGADGKKITGVYAYLYEYERDENGNLVLEEYKTTSNKVDYYYYRPIIKRDENGNVVYRTDANGDKIAVYDAKNRHMFFGVDSLGNVISGGNDDVGFYNCTNLNSVLVFPEGYTGYNDVTGSYDSNQRGDCLGEGVIKSCATQDNPLTIVFLGRIDRISIDKKNGKTSYTTFVFANPANTSFENLVVGSAYNNDNAYTNQNEIYVVFCHAEGGAQRYKINFEKSSENAFVPVLKTTLVDGTTHVNNPKAQGDRVVSGATCTDNEKVVDICFCGKTFNEHYVEGTALGHDNVILSLKYENGFTVNGVKHVCCVRDNCEYENDEAVSAIFAGFLYATREEDDGICGLVFTYEINNEALALYESLNDTEITFGALSVAEHNLGSNSPIGTDGKANQDKVVRAQLSGTGINHVDYIIRGSADAWNAVFNADTGATVKDVKFYILGYVIENGSVNYFLGENTNGDITKLSATTYNLATNA